MTQTDDYPQGERFYVCHHENRFDTLFVQDLSGKIPFPLIYTTDGSARDVFGIVQALRKGLPLDRAPDFICDPTGTIKRAPESWGSLQDSDL